MIDYSGLTNKNPNIAYDKTDLVAEGFELKFSLDKQNPEYQNVIVECTKQNIPYKLMDGEGKQKHIWIKGWKNI